MRLYHRPGSRSTRVLWTLEEIGAPYELTIISREEKASDEHARRHPLRRVPVLGLDDGTNVFESAAICLFLGDLFPESGVVPPPATTARALTYQWTVFAMAELEPAVYDWRRARRAEQDETPHAERFAPIGDAFRERLADRDWLLGDTFTVADVLCSSILETALRRELVHDTGTLRSYVDRAQARPANVRAEAIRE